MRALSLCISLALTALPATAQTISEEIGKTGLSGNGNPPRRPDRADR